MSDAEFSLLAVPLLRRGSLLEGVVQARGGGGAFDTLAFHQLLHRAELEARVDEAERPPLEFEFVLLGERGGFVGRGRLADDADR